MTNVLDLVGAVLKAKGIDAKKGFMPPGPDSMTALFEYAAGSPQHSFGGTDIVEAVQARTRDTDAGAAFAAALAIAGALDRYRDRTISITQSTPVLHIGWDNANPQRAECTVNFIIRRY